MVIFKIPKVIGINYDVKSPATTITSVLFKGSPIGTLLGEK